MVFPLECHMCETRVRPFLYISLSFHHSVLMSYHAISSEGTSQPNDSERETEERPKTAQKMRNPFPPPEKGKNIRNGPFFIQLKWNFHALLFLRDVPIKKRTFYVRENDTCKGCFRKNMRNSNQLGDIFWNRLEGHMSSFYPRAK